MRVALLVLFTLCCYAALSQSGASTPFREGDNFRKETRVNSNAVIQEGVQVIDAGFQLVVSQVYSVNGVTSTGPLFTVRTNAIVDTVVSGGMQHVYASASLADPRSLIEKRIGAVLTTPYTATGKKAANTASPSSTDHLFEIAGLAESYLYPDGAHPLLPIPFERTFSPGYKWTHVDSMQDARRSTTYNLVSTNGNTATLTFTWSSKGTNANTNAAGSLVVDTRTGLILERITQSVTAGFIRVNGVLCAIDRKTAISERVLQ